MTTYVNTNTVGADAPAGSAYEVTPGAAPLECGPTRALWIGEEGDITVTMWGSKNSVTFAGIPAGRWMPLMVTHVTSATAGSIVAVM